jgi:cytochrome c peroxidase
MQHRARARVRLRRLVGSSVLASALVAAGSGCKDEGPLSEEEMTQLRAFMLPPSLPADTSNAFADDPAAAALGKKLYFDGGYSGKLLAPYNSGKDINGALGAPDDQHVVSCAACHDPATGGADQRSKPNATSLGAQYTRRNAPTVINAAYSAVWQFWDGRADSLWSQALSPPEGIAECNSGRLQVAHFLHDSYRSDYEAVFGAGSLADVPRFPLEGTPADAAYKGMTPEDQKTLNTIYANFGKAIAAYERQLISTNFEPSPFDKFMAGQKDAMEPAAVRGARLFVGHAGCTECHVGPTFTDHSFHNIGVPQAGQYVPAMDDGRFDGIGALIAGNVVRFDRSSDFSDAKDDTYLVALGTAAPDDSKGQFKTPTLRNVAKTAPYMHDGIYQTLWDVVNHYNFGGATGTYAGEKDPAIAPLMLTDAELGDLVEFLEALSDGPPLDPNLIRP